MTHWTKKDIQYLKANYYKTDLGELAKHLNRSKNSIINKQSVTNKVKQRKKKADIDNCPNCKREINRVEMGYFCKYCLKEYDNYGDLIAPLL